MMACQQNQVPILQPDISASRVCGESTSRLLHGELHGLSGLGLQEKPHPKAIAQEHPAPS